MAKQQKSEMPLSSEARGAKTGGGAQDAIGLLMADHESLRKLFEEFERLKEDGTEDEKADIVEQICQDLIVHVQIEEEIFYPAVRDAIDDDDLMNESEVEHESAKNMIEEIQDMEPDEELYDARVTVLGEYIDHHVEEEHAEMFPQVRKARLDLKALGAEMAGRKRELIAELMAEKEDLEDEDFEDDLEDEDLDDEDREDIDDDEKD